jgi:3-hydroxyisobutyrate dehydrogenase
MAGSLADAKIPLTVFDLDASAASGLLDKGARLAGSVAELAANADVIFTSLPGPPEFEAVVLAEDGIYGGLRAGQVVFDLSTNSLSLVRRAHGMFAEKQASLLDAPVSGGPAGAASRDLVLWVGGERAVFDAHLPVLKAIAKMIRYVGQVGAGTITKLSHNMLGYMIMQAEAEIFSVAVKAGMDPLELWSALRLGMVGKASPLEMLKRQFLPGTYEPPAFLLRLAHKDVTLATDLGRELGVPMRMAGLTLAEMTEAVAKGMGNSDSRAYLQLQLERAGVTIAVAPDDIVAAERGE